MLDLPRLLTSVASSAIGLRNKRGSRALGFLGGSHRSFLPSSSLIGLAGLAVGAYQIFKDKSASPAAARVVQPGTRVVDSQERELGLPASAPPPPTAAAAAHEVGDLPLRAVRVMIAAARCDGQLGEEEIGELLSTAKDSGIETQMRAEWQRPRPLAEICAGVTDPAQKRDLYVLAFTVLRADDDVSGAERVFLAQLAARLGLTPEQAATIEKETAHKIDSIG
ncbi:MAG TPA: DUF533 domain-containing protein [Planctomycetota bacterium]|nr:DUF533 domain-containing protein [Planctomycetota bacterium]